jgi:hypothetical protein
MATSFGAVELVCSNKESAKEQAEQLVDGHDVELWEGERLIEIFRVGNVR